MSSRRAARAAAFPVPPAPRRYPRRIVLVGLRGSGKTTVGRALARGLGFRFVDLDRRLVREEGRSIAAIFEDEGERGFRRRESALVRRLAARAPDGRGEVWATGGGVVLSAENRRRLRRAGAVVWLACSPERCAARIDADRRARARGDRPALTRARSLEAELRALARARRPFYEEVAHVRIDADDADAASVARSIRAALAAAVARARAAR